MFHKQVKHDMREKHEMRKRHFNSYSIFCKTYTFSLLTFKDQFFFSLYLSPCPSVSVAVSPSLYVSLCLSLSVCLSVSLSLCLFALFYPSSQSPFPLRGRRRRRRHFNKQQSKKRDDEYYKMPTFLNQNRKTKPKRTKKTLLRGPWFGFSSRSF